jgi:hypothetical protein
MPRGQMPDETRARVTSAGGLARAATMTEAEHQALGRAGAAAIHSGLGIARRLVKKWADLDEAERAAVLAVLIDGLPLKPQ